MGKTAIEFSALDEQAKYEEYAIINDALDALVALHSRDPFLQVTICGDMLVRIHFNGACTTDKPSRHHLDELLKVLTSIRNSLPQIKEKK